VQLHNHHRHTNTNTPTHRHTTTTTILRADLMLSLDSSGKINANQAGFTRIVLFHWPSKLIQACDGGL